MLAAVSVFPRSQGGGRRHNLDERAQSKARERSSCRVCAELHEGDLFDLSKGLKLEHLREIDIDFGTIARHAPLLGYQTVDSSARSCRENAEKRKTRNDQIRTCVKSLQSYDVSKWLKGLHL